MSACEKCWSDSFASARGTGDSQTDCYYQLLEERKDNPCSPKEQAWQWWDEEHQCDSRKLEKERK